MYRLVCLSIFLLVTVTSSFALDTQYKTYVNKQYYFSLKYPQNLKPRTSHFYSFYHLPVSWTADVSAQKHHGQRLVVSIPIASIKNRADGFYFYAAVRVGVSSNRKDVAECYQLPSDSQTKKPEPIMLSGQRFMSANFMSLGMSQYAMGKIYRTLYKKRCYSLEYVDAGINNALSRKLSAHYMPIMQEITQSFQFV